MTESWNDPVLWISIAALIVSEILGLIDKSPYRGLVHGVVTILASIGSALGTGTAAGAIAQQAAAVEQNAR